jgi:phenylacetate-CoA ligase
LKAFIYENVVARRRVRESAPLEKIAASFTSADVPVALDAILSHAVAKVPYYRRIAEGKNLPAGSKLSLQDFPILTRTDLQSNFDALKSDDSEMRNSRKDSTGGSTGQPVIFLQDSAHRAWVRASEEYLFRNWFGIDRSRDPKIILWGSAVDLHKSKNWIMKKWMLACSNTYLLNAFRMSPEILRGYVAAYNRIRPKLIKGYSVSVYTLCRFVRDYGLKLSPPPVAVYTAADMLSAEMREVIEGELGCRVTDIYGSREVGLAAAQCPLGKYHILNFICHLEILRPDGTPAAPGEEGRIVITTLRNYSMPLIRYEIGDFAVAGEKCTCGLESSSFDSIRGRMFDYFTMPDGNLIEGGYFTKPMFNRPWVEEFQVLQTKVDEIELHLKLRGKVPANEREEIMDQMQKIAGANIRIIWMEVDEIPRSRHGKLFFCRSLVTKSSTSGS